MTTRAKQLVGLYLALAYLVAALPGASCDRTPNQPVPVSVAPQDAGWEPLATGGSGGMTATGGQAPAPICRAVITVSKSPRARPKAIRPRIVGGTPALSGVWPWAVALETSTGFQFCGGSLVAPRWVLTAAHCEVRPGERAVTGRLDLRQPGGRVTVVEVRTHELYVGVESGHDVALLRLDSSVDLLPVGLVDATWAGPGVLAAVVGWGLTDEYASGTSPILRQTEVPLLAAETCAAAYPGVTATMLCAGYPEGGRDTCQGDSGGGLYVQAGGWRQAGITSWGDGCARPGKPGVYTSVASVREWIDACMVAP